jgi:hypothetical protein
MEFLLSIPDDIDIREFSFLNSLVFFQLLFLLPISYKFQCDEIIEKNPSILF